MHTSQTPRSTPANKHRVTTDHDSITHNEHVINFTIRRSTRRRKTIELYVDPNGFLKLSAPIAITQEECRQTIRSKADWIIRTISKTVSNPQPVIRYENGGSFPLHGKPRPMTFETSEDASSIKVYYQNGSFRIVEPETKNEAERIHNIQNAIMQWCIQHAKATLPELVKRWWKNRPECKHPHIHPYNLQPGRVQVRNQKTRWGSCSPNGNISLNWRLVLLPVDLADYVIIHELSHLRIRNHSPDFWAEVDNFIGDSQNRRRRLREATPGLPL